MSMLNGSHVTLSTGVVLRVKKVSRNLIADIIARHAPPSVPLYYNEEKGRQEENPDDPEYLSALQMYRARLGNDINNAIILDGTEIESVPEALEPMTSSRWLERMRLKGYNVDGQDARYLYWVKFVAADDSTDDFRKLIEGVKRQMGILETDVQASVKRF